VQPWQQLAIHLIKQNKFIPAKDFLVDIADVDSTKSFNVFISHRWIRGWDGAPGYDKRAHTDDRHKNKYKLIIEGVEKFWKAAAPGMTECHVWLDFSCINQDGDPAGELKDLDNIVGWADAMFTPIVDTKYITLYKGLDYKIPETRWILPSGYVDIWEEYQSDDLNLYPNGYIHRSWCRIEMMNCALVPFRADSDSVERLNCFRGGLLHALKNGRRHHVLYGGRESRNKLQPISVPPLLFSNFDKYDPIKGTLSNEGDRGKISQLVRDLDKYKKDIVVGYVGERDADGI
jgi:hypothetical protein